MKKRDEIEEFDDILEEDNNENNNGFFRKLFFFLILISIVIVIYARYIGVSGLIIKEYSIENDKIPKSFDGLKIAHFSDFHYGRTTNINSLKKLVKEINLTKPDIVVFTGDFFDGSSNINDEKANKIIEELSSISSTYGKYYITGNHDVKFTKYEEIFNNSDFYNLNDKYDIILSKMNESILISGTNYNSDLTFYEEMIKNSLPTYKINIMHIPDTYDDISHYNFDLVLAGHSHNGQITIPFYGAIYTPDGSKKYYKPYYKLNNTDMYISSGLGTSVYNFRLFNRPSFNLYRLNAK